MFEGDVFRELLLDRMDENNRILKALGAEGILVTRIERLMP